MGWALLVKNYFFAHYCQLIHLGRPNSTERMLVTMAAQPLLPREVMTSLVTGNVNSPSLFCDDGDEEEEDADDEDDVVDDDDDLIKFIVRMLVGCISHVEFTTIQGTQVGAVAPIRQALHGRDSRFMGLIYIPH